MNGKIGNAEQMCFAQRVMVTDGRGNGARQIYIANGRIHAVLSESNALDVLRLWHGGTNVGFVSKNGLYTAPTDFLHAFPAGMLYTCGLDAIGCVEGHPMHGRLHSIPAEVRECSADETGVRIVADIRDTALFGANLRLRRTVTLKAGADELKIEDTIANEAFRDEKYCLLYHVNAGYPLVDAGATVSGNLVSSRPRNEWAAKHAKTMLAVEPPKAGFEEMCYFHLTKDGAMSIANGKLGKRLTVKSSLRKFVQWKSRASGDFVMALEPCTCWLDGEMSYETLAPGASVTHTLALCVEDCVSARREK